MQKYVQKNFQCDARLCFMSEWIYFPGKQSLFLSMYVTWNLTERTTLRSFCLFFYFNRREHMCFRIQRFIASKDLCNKHYNSNLIFSSFSSFFLFSINFPFIHKIKILKSRRFINLKYLHIIKISDSNINFFKRKFYGEGSFN